MFNSAEDILKLCKKENKKVSDIMLAKEIEEESMSEGEIFEKLSHTWSIMQESATAALNEGIESVSGLTSGNAKRLREYSESGKAISGDFLTLSMARALSTSEVNASMGRIVAAPTAGGAGILPAAMMSAKEKLNLTEDEILKGFLTAGAIGELIAKNATISGAEGGCQAECGAASAMAAGAIVEMAGGSPEDVFNAAGFAITHVLGMVCDPIAGLVEYPCIVRNSSGVINAFISADTAMAGVQAVIPFDEIVSAMFKVGTALPETLRETGLGGLAATDTGKKYAEEILGE